MRGNEVFQNGQTFTEACLNGQLDCTTGRIAHKSAHTAQLTNLVHTTTGAGVRHHPNGVVLFHYVLNQVFHASCGSLPNFDNSLVAFVVGKQTFFKVVFDCDNLLFGFVQDGLLFRRNVHIEHACGKSADCGVLVAESLYVVQHEGRGAGTAQLEAFFHDFGKLLFADKMLLRIANHILRKGKVDAQRVALFLFLGDDFRIDDKFVFLFHRRFGIVVVNCRAENGSADGCPNFGAVALLDVNDGVQSDVVSDVRFVRFVETAVIVTAAQNCDFFVGQSALFANVVVQIHTFTNFFHVAANGCEVVATQNHVLRGRDNRLAVGKFQNVVGSKHKVSGFGLRFDTQRYVNCHLVAVEVGVECRTSKRMQLDCSSLDKHGFECLNGQSVQRRRTVKHNWMVFDDFFQNVPNLCVGAFHALFGGFYVVALIGFHKFFHYERLEQFQCHFLWDTALVKFKLWTYDDNRTTGVVDTFTQKVLTETTLLAAEQSGKGFEFAVACACLRTLAAAVIQKAVDGVLQHTFFVVDQDFRSVDFDKFLQAIVTIDNSAVQIVKVAGCVSAAVQRNHCAQFGRKHGQHGQNHPFGTIAALAEGFDDVQTLDCANLFCALRRFCKNIAQFLGFGFQVDVLQQFAHRFGTGSGAEVQGRIFLCLCLRFAIFAHAQNLLILHSAEFGIDYHVALEVDKLFQILGRHIQNKSHSGRSASEIPNVRNGSGKFDVSHAFATHLGFCNFNAALFANDAFVSYSFILSAMAFPVLDGPENSFAKQTVFFRLLRAVVDCFGFFNFSVRPLANLFRRGNADLNGSKIVHYARPCQSVGTQRRYRLSC